MCPAPSPAPSTKAGTELTAPLREVLLVSLVIWKAELPEVDDSQ